MKVYEFCQVINDRDGKRYRDVAEVFTPYGLVQVEASQFDFPMSMKKTISKLNEFQARVERAGWVQLSNNSKYYSRPYRPIPEGVDRSGLFIAVSLDPGEFIPVSTDPEHYEYCVIDFELMGTVKSGIFSKKQGLLRYISYKLTPNEVVEIESTAPATAEDMRSTKNSMVRLLIDNGWKSVEGKGDYLKRRVSNEKSTVASSSSPDDHIETLKQLAELRDTGVLTEEEFKKKKGEILDKM